MGSFGFSVGLFRRSSPVAYVDLTHHVRNSWMSTERAQGGYWSAEAEITTVTMSPLEMVQLYNVCIGQTAREYTAGILTWEGEVVAMEIELNGLAYRRTMDPEIFHNRVKVQHRYPVDEDSNQGNMAYNPGGHSAAFQDDGQDFSDYESLAGEPDYMITVYNDDATFCYAWCGPDFTTTNANDSIDVFRNLDRDSGWNGDTGGKTPSSYVISYKSKAGSTQETAWTADADAQSSIDRYGYSEYIAVHGELTDDAATAMRDRRLVRHLWPSSRAVGGLSTANVRGVRDARLRIICAGYALSMNRRFYELDLWATGVSDQITTLVGTSDYVSAGVIDANTTLTSVRGSEIPARTWDLVDELIEQGDTSGNDWRGGVGYNRRFDYQQTATTVTYHWRSGQVTDTYGVPIWPTLIKPDKVIHVAGLLPREAPPDGGDWHSNQYISAVEFIAPRFYRLTTGRGLSSATGL